MPSCARCWNWPCTCGYEHSSPGGGPSPRDHEQRAKEIASMERRIVELERQVKLLMEAHPRVGAPRAKTL